MHTSRKHIAHSHFLHLILLLTQHLQIPRQCSRVTAYIHNSLRFHRQHGFNQSSVTTFSWRVHYNYICIYTIFFIFCRQNFFCLTHKKFRIVNAVNLCIFSCIFNSCRNDFHTINFLCLLCQKQRNRSNPAV